MFAPRRRHKMCRFYETLDTKNFILYSLIIREEGQKMLKASEARKIARGYNSEAAQQMRKHVEELIKQRALDGFFWMDYDYNFEIEYNGVAPKEVQEMIYDLRKAGYDVKDHWVGKQLTLHW